MRISVAEDGGRPGPRLYQPDLGRQPVWLDDVPVHQYWRPEAETATRQLHTDDIAWSSFNYAEASFNDEFSVIRGEISDVDGTGILGSNVYAVDQAGNRAAVTAHSETLRVLGINGGLFVAPPAIGIVDGTYELPLPRGNY